jgi:hypothetical protein
MNSGNPGEKARSSTPCRVQIQCYLTPRAEAEEKERKWNSCSRPRATDRLECGLGSNFLTGELEIGRTIETFTSLKTSLDFYRDARIRGEMITAKISN